LSALLEDYKGELEQIKKTRKEILENARHEAENLLTGTNKEIERTIRIIKETQAGKEQTKEARKNLEIFKRSLTDDKISNDQALENKLEAVRRHAERYTQKLTVSKPLEMQSGNNLLVPGDFVRILNLNTEGEILEISGENVLVTYGESMITAVKRSNLEKISPKEIKSGRLSGIVSQYDWSISQRKLNFKSEIDIRGKRGEEALEIVRNFIDDATIVGVSELRILHGKGNGILKTLVREYLKTLEVVRSCKDEHVEHGGSGITVVTLDF
jgi:DNA mismatch repair protein MutS2